jgi:hypothetical protein
MDPAILDYVKSRKALPQSFVVGNKYMVGRGPAAL